MKTKTTKPKAKKENKKNSTSTKNFKQKYFDYYDDVKHYTKGKEDW